MHSYNESNTIVTLNRNKRIDDKQQQQQQQQHNLNHQYTDSILVQSKLYRIKKRKKRQQPRTILLLQLLLLVQVPLLYNNRLLLCCIVTVILHSSSSSNLSLLENSHLFAYAINDNRLDDNNDSIIETEYFKFNTNENNINNDTEIPVILQVEQQEQRILQSTNDNKRTLQIQNKQQSTKSTTRSILIKAGKYGLGSGISGAIAGIVQVLTLMWIRTIICYQSRYGGGMNFFQALKILLNDGGVQRLYRGVSFALIQAPLSRFISTAASDSVHSILSNISYTKNWGPQRTTLISSIVAGIGRLLLMRT
jgi:hypothetical protein